MPEADSLRHGDLPVDGRTGRSPRRALVLAHGLELFVAAAGVLTTVQFLLDPHVRTTTAIGDLGLGYAWAWISLYFVGSVGVIAGLLKPADRIEIAGLCCFAAASLVNGAALLQVRDGNGVYVALLFLALALGSWSRIYLLLALRRLTPASSAKRG